MKEESFLYQILCKLGLKKRINYNSVEYLRSRGIKVGENVHIFKDLILIFFVSYILGNEKI